MTLSGSAKRESTSSRRRGVAVGPRQRLVAGMPQRPVAVAVPQRQAAAVETGRHLTRPRASAMSGRFRTAIVSLAMRRIVCIASSLLNRR